MSRDSQPLSALSPSPAPAAPERRGPGWVAVLAWLTLGFNIAVALWGAYVRASGSGAGCGAHWPLCNGELVPLAPRTATVIEFAHRVSSGVDTFLTLALTLIVFRFYPRRHRVRRASFWALIFLLNEAVIGALLVLLRQVGQNGSLSRVFFLSLHLVNTFVLLGLLALTAWWAMGQPGFTARVTARLRRTTLAVLAATVLLGISGAIAALGDTLFPSHTLAGGLRQDVAHTAPLLLRARVFHPALAVLLVLLLLGWAHSMMARGLSPIARRMGWLLTAIAVAQIAIGVVNVALLAPIPVQIVHLAGAYALWVSLVLFAAALLAGHPGSDEVKEIQA